MSTQITTAFVEQYKNNVQILSQQRGSVLERAVMVDSAVVGKRKFAEQISSTAAVLRTTRHADSPLVNTPHARRVLSLADYEWGDLIDDADKVRMLIDPTSPYSMNAAMAMGRAKDDVIIAAATGTAYTGVSGTTAVTLASGATNYIEDDADDDQNSGAATNYNLTIAKLRRAKYLLDNGDVDPSLKRYCVIGPSQMQSLLFTTKVTSTDYNAVKALVQGDVNSFLGFQFIMTTRLSVASNVRLCFAFAEGGIELGIGQDIKARISERADKAYSTYVYYSMSLGATRLEEAKVVAIECNEAAAFSDS